MYNTNPPDTLLFLPIYENLRVPTDADIERTHASQGYNGCNRDGSENPLRLEGHVPKTDVAKCCALGVFGGN